MQTNESSSQLQLSSIAAKAASATRPQRGQRSASGFPSWAPEHLISLHASYHWNGIIIVDDDEYGDLVLLEVDVLEHLLRQPRMEAVWAALSRRHITKRQQSDLNYLIFRSLRASRHGPPRRSRSDHRAHFQTVAKMAIRLARAISKDLAVHRPAVVGRLESRLKRAQQKPFFIPEDGTTYGELLQNLADDADRLGKHKPTLSRVGSPDAEAQILAMGLCKFFLEHFGSPLYEHVATIANVMTDREVTPDAVRKQWSRRGR